MATVSFSVLKYTIGLSSPLAWNLGGKGVDHVASILCTGNSEYRLIVGFQPLDASPGVNYYDAEQKTAYLIRPQSEYQWYVDILRNEKPVFARIIESEPAFTILYTGAESVGEGELLPRSIHEE